VQILDADPVERAVIALPVHAALGILLLLFGRALTTAAHSTQPPAETPDQGPDEGLGFRDRILSNFGRLVTLTGSLGLIAAGLGYSYAAGTFLVSTALTIALLSTLILLQTLVFDTWALITRRPADDSDALVPVLIAFALTVLALPVLALIWGARVSELTEIWARAREGFTLGDTRIAPSQFLIFAAVFTGLYVLTRLTQSGLRSSVLPKTRLDIGAQNAVVAGIGYIGIVAGSLIAIASAGVNLSALGFVAGALSVGIGFGLQNIVSNFVSGIILLIERPISQGDWIEVGGQMGYVRDISVRATRIETFDRTDVIIPNADFISGTVINWTRGNSIGRVIVPVGVAYGSDTQKVSDILLSIAREHPMVLMNPAPYVYFKGFGADGMDFEIRAILRDINWVLSVQTEMNHAIVSRFAEEGIEIPFPQRDLWLRNPETLRGAGHDAPSTAEQSGAWREALKGERPDVVKGENG